MTSADPESPSPRRAEGSDASTPDASIIFGIELTLRPTASGGRARPLDPTWAQYRPNWGFAGLQHPQQRSGGSVLCWRDAPLNPGDTTFAALQPTFPASWNHVVPGDVIYLYEGLRLCGLGLICTRYDPDGPSPDRSSAVRSSAWVHLGVSPSAWQGVEGVISADGVLALPDSNRRAVLEPTRLSRDDRQLLGSTHPWGAALVIDGEHVQRAYDTGPDPLLAVFAGEQRWLVEEAGSEPVGGGTSMEKARRRLRTLRHGPHETIPMGRLALPDPWQNLDGREPHAVEARTRLLDELQREARPGHELFGLDVDVVARCSHCDDIVVRSSQGWWRVHLTYSANERPPWPVADRFDAPLQLVEVLTTDEHWIGDFIR